MAGAAPKFLGRGWRFPPRFDLAFDARGRPAGPGTVAMVAGEADIRESLYLLFSTLRGERVLLPTYGSALAEHVLDPTDATDLGRLRSQIEDSILLFEPRIKVEEVDFDHSRLSEGCLMIRVSYWIPSVNSRSNMVYPFYFGEGTNIRRILILQRGRSTMATTDKPTPDHAWQAARWMPALDWRHFGLDERRAGDLALRALGYARLLTYHDSRNRPHPPGGEDEVGAWESFFRDDVSFLLAEICSVDAPREFRQAHCAPIDLRQSIADAAARLAGWRDRAEDLAALAAPGSLEDRLRQSLRLASENELRATIPPALAQRLPRGTTRFAGWIASEDPAFGDAGDAGDASCLRG